MARRSSSRSSSKGLSYYAFFWIAPTFAVVLAPIYLHAGSKDLSESTDDHMFAVLALLLTIISLSVIGCVLDEVCQCSKEFPIILLLTQMTLVVGAIVLKSTMFDAAGAPKPGVQESPGDAARSGISGHFLSHGPLLSAMTSASDSSKSPLALHEGPVGPQHVGDPAGALAKATGVPKGFTDGGDGYCQDGKSREEFSSQHSNGKTLEACAEAALSDYSAIGFDFSRSDGGCDIRYPAGALNKDIAGYDWWGWGAGVTNPVGFGKQKHGAETHCYAKIIVATPAPVSGPVNSRPLTAKIHPFYHSLIREYPFQPVRTDRGDLVNVILVRSPFRSHHQEQLFHKYKNEILFIGISSFEDFPLPPPNPFSGKFPADKYVGLFPGFLHMFRDTSVFPRHVKLLLMSQSDFSTPNLQPSVPKEFDFAFSGSDQDVQSDCVGWSSYAKNWTFVKQALEVMCGDLGMTGVLVATMDKAGRKACTIPDSCRGKIKQTKYLSQDEFYSYVRRSRFLFVPQVHDASPRVTTQALGFDVPLLMNRNLIGGWKYINEKTGEFFNDLSDIRASLEKILRNTKSGGVYEPRKYCDEHLGDEKSGRRLKEFVEQNFQDRVKLPEGTRLLFPAGA